MKVYRWIARIIVLGRRHFFRILAILAHKTFHSRPGLDQGAVGGEVFVAGPLFLARELIDLGKEQLGGLRQSTR